MRAIVVLTLASILFVGCGKSKAPTAPEPAPTPGILSIAPDTLTVTNSAPSGALVVSTSSASPESWRIVEKPAWAHISPDSGTTSSQGYTIAMTVDTTGLAYGTIYGILTIATPTDSIAATIRLLNSAPAPKLYGPVSTNRTLTAAFPGPNYDIIGDLTVQPSVTLTVEPGVTLRLSPNSDLLGSGRNVSASELIVHGTLVVGSNAGALATINGPVNIESDGLLTAENTTTTTNAMLVLGNASFDNCALAGTYASAGMYIEGGTVSVTRTTFTSGISQLTGALIVTDCTFVCGNAVIARGGSVSLRRCTVTAHGDGFVFDGATVGTVQECSLTGSGTGTGIKLCAGISTVAPDTTNVQPTSVRGFDTGVALSPGATARNILVSGMANNGISASGSASCTVNYCTVVGNGAEGIFMTADSCFVLNSIITSNGSYGVHFGASTSRANYSDSWNNWGGNWVGPTGTFGSSISSYDPAFADAISYALSAASLFLHFGGSGGQIGAYGPGQ